jgi:hypothetical protein
MSSRTARTPIASTSTFTTTIANNNNKRASRVSDLAFNVRPITPQFIADQSKSTAVFRGSNLANHSNKLAELDRNVVAPGGGGGGGGGGKRKLDMVDLTVSTEPVLNTTTSSLPPTTNNKRFKSVNNNLDISIKPTAPTTATNEAKSKLKAKRERVAQHEKMTAESVTWRQKYKKAFPSFVFYFDAVDSSTELSLVKSVERLGAVRDMTSLRAI